LKSCPASRNMGEFLGLEFAPLNIPFRRRLETFSAAAWFVTMVFGGFIGLFLSIYSVLYTSLWWITSIYLFWALVIDKHTAERGGRVSEWVRSWTWWKYVRDYFPASLERVPWMELKPDKNYIFVCYPHGMICTGPFVSFGSNHGGFSDLFPCHKTHIIALNQHFSMPFFRELALGLGGCKASSTSINHIISKPEGGNVAVLMVGGAAEAFYCKPRQYKLIYNNRKGFCKLALRNGTPLVPVITFGETDLFDQMENPEGSILRKIQEFLKKYIGMAFAVPVGRGFFQYNFGMVPKRKPITTLVGHPMEVDKIVDPTIDDINKVHEKFRKQLVELFESNKHTYIENADPVHLEFL